MFMMDGPIKAEDKPNVEKSTNGYDNNTFTTADEHGMAGFTNGKSQQGSRPTESSRL